MTTRVESLLKSLVLAASGLMLYQKVSSGTVAFYINQRFEWLVLTGALIYVALALTQIYRLVAPWPKTLTEQMLGPARSSFTSWSAVLILAIPALIGAVAPARPLGASAIESRGVGLQSAPASAGGGTTLKRAPNGPRTILDWLREISSSGDPAALAGQQADVIGFVYRDDPRFSGKQFMVSRFTVACCVADASALGLIVETDQLDQFKQDQWVRVVGRFSTGQFANETVPIIKAEKIEATEQPAAPYLYP
jgi:putative membrane protein